MYFTVYVTAGARKEQITQTDAQTYAIAVREPAARNMANRRVCEILRELHDTNEVRIVSGHRSRKKIVTIPDLSEPNTAT